MLDSDLHFLSQTIILKIKKRWQCSKFALNTFTDWNDHCICACLWSMTCVWSTSFPRNIGLSYPAETGQACINHQRSHWIWLVFDSFPVKKSIEPPEVSATFRCNWKGCRSWWRRGTAGGLSRVRGLPMDFNEKGRVGSCKFCIQTTSGNVMFWQEGGISKYSTQKHPLFNSTKTCGQGSKPGTL